MGMYIDPKSVTTGIILASNANIFYWFPSGYVAVFLQVTYLCM